MDFKTKFNVGDVVEIDGDNHTISAIVVNFDPNRGSIPLVIWYYFNSLTDWVSEGWVSERELEGW